MEALKMSTVTVLEYAGDGYIQEVKPKVERAKVELTDAQKDRGNTMARKAIVKTLAEEGLFTEGMTDKEMVIQTIYSKTYNARIKAICYNRARAVQRIADNEDITQAVYMGILENAGDIQPMYYFRSIFYLALDATKNETLFFKRFKVAIAPRGHSADQFQKENATSDNLFHSNLGGVDQLLSKAWIDQFVSLLPSDYTREVFNLHFRKGLSMAEIDRQLLVKAAVSSTNGKSTEKVAKYTTKTAVDLIKRHFKLFWNLSNPAAVVAEKAYNAPAAPPEVEPREIEYSTRIGTNDQQVISVRPCGDDTPYAGPLNTKAEGRDIAKLWAWNGTKYVEAF
jgi:DNA-directed RNA polymerase specialized sigma24 family protein